MIYFFSPNCSFTQYFYISTNPSTSKTVRIAYGNYKNVNNTKSK